MWADIFTELKPLIFSGLALHEKYNDPAVYPSTLSLLNKESLRQLHQNHSRAESTGKGAGCRQTPRRFRITGVRLAGCAVVCIDCNTLKHFK